MRAAARRALGSAKMPRVGVAGEDRHAPIAVWVVEDHRLLRESLASLIDEQPDLACALAVGSCEAMQAALDRGERPEVALMDLGLPGASGLEGVRRLRELAPRCATVVLTIRAESDLVFAAICAGAIGYLLKPSPPERIVEAIRAAAAGASPIHPAIARKVLAAFARDRRRQGEPESYALTARELEILALLVEGRTLKDVAGELGVSIHTVDNHVRSIYGKLQVDRRARAVAKAIEDGLV